MCFSESPNFTLEIAVCEVNQLKNFSHLALKFRLFEILWVSQIVWTLTILILDDDFDVDI